MIGEIRQNFTEASASVGLILATALITVSSITKNTGRYAMIHTAFFMFLQTLLSIYHIMLLVICTTQVKKRVKKRFKKKKREKENKVTKNLL